MHASLLSTFQTEPWSLMFLGAALFALSSVARRRSGAAVNASPVSGASADRASGNRVSAPPSVAPVYASPRSLRGRLRSRLANAA